MNEIAVIIVTYNRKELLMQCIESVRRQTYTNLDIIVIDNASSDGTSDLLKKYSDILYFNTGSNLGGAGGFNFGMRKAVELGYKYLWVMDDDTFPKEDAVEEFRSLDDALGGNYGFLSGKVLWKDESICFMNRQKKSKWKYLKDFSKIQKIQYASFVSLFIRTDMVREMGLPIKDFFIWADDWEYTRRISRNKNCYFVPASQVVHWCDSNVGADIIHADSDRIKRFRYMYRNDVCLYRMDGLEGYVYLLIRTFLHMMRIIVKAKDKRAKLKVMFSSLWEGRKFHPDIEYIR